MNHLTRHGLICGAVLALAIPATAAASEIAGYYMEARTCQVYTGPCFANGEVGLTGKDAVMAWSVQDGQFEGIDISGLNVVVVVRSTDTLGFQGIAGAGDVKSVVLVDERASESQRKALIGFAKQQSGKAGETLVRVEATSIEMELDAVKLEGKLNAGKQLQLQTRKARPEDCICSNESAYYPPLAKVEFFAAGVATEGSFTGRGLGSHWSIPDSRSAYMATFRY
jgi:hypothetical protein